MKPFLQLLLAILRLPGYKLLLVWLWLLVLTVFLWLPQINLAAYILTSAPLDFGGKLSFFLDYYGRALSGISNPIVLTMVIFSFLTALGILMLVFMIRTSRRMKLKYNSPGKAFSGVAVAAVGSHILSCGGTLLVASIFPAFSGTSAVLGGTGANINLWLATGANLVGIIIVAYAIRKLYRDTARMLLG